MSEVKDKIMAMSIFKYGLIHELVTGSIKPGAISKRIKELAGKEYINPVTGKYVRIGESTIYRYLKLYREQGIKGLKRKLRNDKGSQKAFSKEVLDYAIKLRKELSSRTTLTIIDILKKKFKMTKLSKSTLNYHLDILGYSRRRLKSYADKIFIRFQSTYPNHLWIGDYHDRRGLLKDGREVHVSAFIDCKSRYITHGEYYLKENLFTLEDSFKKATLKCGCPVNCYLDNAKIYHSKRFAYCCLKLGINPPIFSRPYTKEGRGKIEKWFSFIKTNFEAEAIARGGFLSIEELNEHFKAFIELRYHNKVHSETGHKPAVEFAECENKRYPDINILNELFMLTDPRTVAKKTMTVSVLGVKFVTDSFLERKKIEVHYNPNDLSYVLIYHRGIFIMKAEPQQLNTPPGKKIVREECSPDFKYDYLAALKGEYEKMLRENAALIECKNIQPAETDKFYYDDFRDMFSEKLKRKIAGHEEMNLKKFYETYRPENHSIIEQSLSYGIRQYKKDHHLNFYLDIIKLFIFAERSKKS